jgi:hypothetical protein
VQSLCWVLENATSRKTLHRAAQHTTKIEVPELLEIIRNSCGFRRLGKGFFASVHKVARITAGGRYEAQAFPDTLHNIAVYGRSILCVSTPGAMNRAWSLSDIITAIKRSHPERKDWAGGTCVFFASN